MNYYVRIIHLLISIFVTMSSLNNECITVRQQHVINCKICPWWPYILTFQSRTQFKSGVCNATFACKEFLLKCFRAHLLHQRSATFKENMKPMITRTKVYKCLCLKPNVYSVILPLRHIKYLCLVITSNKLIILNQSYCKLCN